MAYRFAVERADYSDYAGGQVFYSLPGRPALPVRLTSEILQRCLALRPAPYRLYDPLCGGAYLLCVLAYLHWEAIRELIGSDIDPEAVRLAERNLALLTTNGLEERRQKLQALAAAYGKESHQAALEALGRLEARLRRHLAVHPIRMQLFQADALDPRSLLQHLGPGSVDVVITDLPYGLQSQWQGESGAAAKAAGRPSPPPAWRLLDALRAVLAPSALVAIAADKKQKIAHERYRRREHFHVGKRQVTILQIMGG